MTDDKPTPVSNMNQRFFGHHEHPLFGVYHRARGKTSGQSRAVLICPPIGQEFIRTHWCLRLLASQLSRKGIHVLRMDYRGIGDSSGAIDQIDSVSIWQSDVQQAVLHLREQTRADSVLVVGLRFGATLAASIASTLADVNSLVLWEPVLNGSTYLQGLRRMHDQMMDLWHCRMKTPNNSEVEEILGSVYARTILNEIAETMIDPAGIEKPQLIVDLTSAETQYRHPEPSLQKVVRVNDEDSWENLDTLETAWLRPQTVRMMVKTIAEMFTRLDRFRVPPLPISSHVPVLESTQ